MRRASWLFRTTAVVVALAAAGITAQDQIRWQPNVESAQRLAGQTNKLILVHCWAPWCKACVQLEKEVFARPEIGKSLDANFVLVKLNVDEAPATARMYGVSSLPTDVILTPTGRLVAQLQSPPTATQYVAQLNRLADGHRELSHRGSVPPVSSTAAAATAAAPPPVAAPAQPVAPPAQVAAAAPPVVTQPQVAAMAPAATTPPAAAAAPSAPPVAAPAAPTPPEDRYANFYAQQQQYQPQQAQAQQPPQAQAPAAPMGPPQAQPWTNAQAGATPSQPPMTPAGPPIAGPTLQPPLGPPAVAQQPVGPPIQQTALQQPAPTPQAPAVQLPPGSPSLALDGYCSVALTEQRRWIPGDRRWGAIHRGRTYLFSGPEEQKRFLANPEAFSPVISGDDPVLALDARQNQPGRREHGVFYNNRIYLFSNEQTLEAFNKNPNRYSAEIIQAMR